MSELNKGLHVVVLMGGWSAEREVSLSSGEGVVKALRERGWSNVTPVDMDRNVAAVIAGHRPDVVFNALHGSPGEDGTVQGMLDLMQVPYTHSGVTTSAVAIDKQLTKAVLEPHGIPMPPGRIVTSASVYEGDPLPRPYVLKPVDEGSSVGVAIVTEETGPITPETTGPWQEFDRLLAEEFIAGHELTVAVLGDEALEVTELKIASGWYDYAHKYEEGQTVHVCPAEVPADIADRMKELALAAHRVLGCKGCSRSDFRWDEERGMDGLFLLETNTQPGMTPLSLVPEQAKARGIDYGELCERLIAEALG
ncbi:D-alanine--D-alanine ligase [Sphingomicrobium aestuariivivum]|uniref:D-alanine--D-alanine ligase n=1 Tax=Sphingomicrobium aestuariivivum TaxID=1582356 RepID=UPI001FD6BF16|nr:D-alanine--D-alanine ligase [Sphingomicrobium aestuariivivum]MCJ8190652.1 D-alanine--D-alanine ligase [Sphingomicrobium aestuariivivum]